MTDEKTDEELMLAVCKGDRSAYQIIVRQHLKSIGHYAFRMLGNRRDTEDITQETFLRLWTNAEKWRPDKSRLSTWLHRIAHNLCIDYLRKHGNTFTRDNLDGTSAASGASDDERSEAFEDFVDNSEQRRQIEKLQNAIAGLPENQRSALMLCHYSGFSNKEAAAIMDVSVKALESALARAKRSLREAFSLIDENATGVRPSEEKAETTFGANDHDS